MPDKHLVEYAVIRVVPRVEREEFLNVGVILFCASQRFLQTRWQLPADRLRAFLPNVPEPELADRCADISARLRALEQVSLGGPGSGPIGQLPPASRFRWLTAARSTVVQTSPVHPGFCTDPADMLTKLFEQLVL